MSSFTASIVYEVIIVYAAFGWILVGRIARNGKSEKGIRCTSDRLHAFPGAG